MDIIANDHGWHVGERHLRYCPRFTTDLGVHLDEDLGDDRADILSSRDRILENNLRWDRHRLEEQSLEFQEFSHGVQRLPVLRQVVNKCSSML